MSYNREVGLTVATLTERELIARIQERLPSAPEWLVVGIGDDAAVVQAERNRVEVLSVDALVEGIHFDRAFVPPATIGYRALAANLSDLAAMGAAPRLALVSLMLPAALPLDDFDEIVRGVVSLASQHRLHVVGGNLTQSPGPLIVDVTVVGTVKPRQALTRSGARPGDELFVSGTIGSAAAGLRLLREGAAPLSSAGSLTERYLRPEPRIRLGTLLARNRAATACMDLSDGLSDAVYQVAEASGVGAIIDGDALPIDPAARAVFESHGVDALEAAIAGGDDYELLAAVRPRTRRRLAAPIRHGGVPLTMIGRCTADRAVLLQRGSRESAPLPRGGYDHFRS